VSPSSPEVRSQPRRPAAVVGGAVVDFIDVGVPNVRFWTFNLADMGITIGR